MEGCFLNLLRHGVNRIQVLQVITTRYNVQNFRYFPTPPVPYVRTDRRLRAEYLLYAVNSVEHCTVLCLCLCEVAPCSRTFCHSEADQVTPLRSGARCWVTINYDNMCEHRLDQRRIWEIMAFSGTLCWNRYQSLDYCTLTLRSAAGMLNAIWVSSLDRLVCYTIHTY